MEVTVPLTLSFLRSFFFEIVILFSPLSHLLEKSAYTRPGGGIDSGEGGAVKAAKREQSMEDLEINLKEVGDGNFMRL